MRVVKPLLAVFAVIAFGLFAMWKLAEYRLDHARFTERMAVVVATPGFSVSGAEREIANPIEQALSLVNGVESIRSVVLPGSVVITTEVTAIGVNAEPPVRLVQEALERTRTALPDDISPPYVQRLDSTPIVRRFIVRADRMSRLELSSWLDEVFRRKVEVQHGVREISFCGDVERELKITLDQQRLRSYGLSTEEVLEAIRNSSVGLPGGRVADQRIALRVDSARLEDLQKLELRGGQVHLQDLATLAVGAEDRSCSSNEMLVSVRVMPSVEELVLPSQPGITLTPFEPRRIASFLSPPGTSMREAMVALGRAFPHTVITAERDELTVMFDEEPQRLNDTPGLALRSMDDQHSLVQVSGPEFEKLIELGGRIRDLLSKNAQARWVGATWPGLGPEQVIKPVRGVKGIAELMQLAIGGVRAGRLEDGTEIRVSMGDVKGIEGLRELRLADGRPVSEVLEISQTLSPAAMLRVNRQRTVELEVGWDAEAIRDVLKTFQLPPGYSVTVR